MTAISSFSSTSVAGYSTFRRVRYLFVCVCECVYVCVCVGVCTHWCEYMCELVFVLVCMCSRNGVSVCVRVRVFVGHNHVSPLSVSSLAGSACLWVDLSHHLFTARLPAYITASNIPFPLLFKGGVTHVVKWDYVPFNSLHI